MTENNQASDLGLRAMLAILRRRAWVILFVTVLAVGAAVGLSELQQREYTATSLLLFRDPGFDQKLLDTTAVTPSTDPTRDAATNLDLVSVRSVAQRTATALGGGLTTTGISDAVDVSPKGDSNIVRIDATERSPELAAAVANTFAEQYIRFRRDADQAKIKQAETLVQGQIDRLSSAPPTGLLHSLRARLEDLRIMSALQTGNAELVQQAERPTHPSAPKFKRNAAIGGFAGLLIGLALALALEQLDRRPRNAEDLADAFGLPLVGRIPRSRALSNASRSLDPWNADAEAFRLLRANLRYFTVGKDLRSVAITSAAPQDGKSTVALNLARAAAETGLGVLLIEADVRHPTLARALEAPDGPGLTNVLTGHSSLAEAVVSVPVAERVNGSRSVLHLDVLVSGPVPPNPGQLMESGEMAALIGEAEAGYDLVVVDTPPTGVVADAIPVIKRVDGVLVVGRVGADTRDELGRLREQLTHLGAHTLGVVANFAKVEDAGYYGGYYTAPRDVAAPLG